MTAGVLIIRVLQEKLSSFLCVVLPNCIILILPCLALQQSELSGWLFPPLFFLFLSCNDSRQKPREKAALDCTHVGGQGQQREQRRVLRVC